MARLATASKKSSRPAQAVRPSAVRLPGSLIAEIERRRVGLARHMTRAIVAVVRWDDSTGLPPDPAAIARACFSRSRRAILRSL